MTKSAKHELLEMLRSALLDEQRAQGRFLEAASVTEDSMTKTLLLRLAGEELIHEKLIQQELSRIGGIE